MPKVLFVSNIFSNLYNFRLGMMQAVKESGHEVAAIASPDESISSLHRAGIRCVPLKNLNRVSTEPAKDMRLLWELYRLYRAEGPALILHFTIKPNIYGTLAAAMAGSKTISSVTGRGSAFDQNIFVRGIAHGLFKVAFRYPEKVFFQNIDDRNFFVQAGLVNREKTLVVPGSGVNTLRFSPDFCQENENKKKMVFILMARMLWEKGLKEFAEAAIIVRRSYSQAEFWLLGWLEKGNPGAVPEEVIRTWEKEPGILYLGAVKDVRPFLCKSSVVVLPSYYREGIPRSLLEAMAMAKPIITTDNQGCRELVEEGKNGFLVPIKNAKALAEAMVKMMKMDTNSLNKFGHYGRLKVIKEFEEQIVITKYLEEIKRVLTTN